jgi:hypothetical protein
MHVEDAEHILIIALPKKTKLIIVIYIVPKWWDIFFLLIAFK